MKVVLRVDASPAIGTGHFYRCLTLANVLGERGAFCYFICRSITDALKDMVLANRHELKMILSSGAVPESADSLPHSGWLGVSQDVDAEDTATVLAGMNCEWLVVDHYALDYRWERRLRRVTNSILVIDDLANRRHDCELLLDQNFYRGARERYANLVPATTKLLCGPSFALLRDEFMLARKSEHCPRTGVVRKVLVFFGGVDSDDWTTIAVRALASLNLGAIEVDVVVGSQHPNREKITDHCSRHGFRLHVQSSQMAQLMAAADLAIGAGGTATWERCSVGLPCVTVAVASNQVQLVQDAADLGIIYAPEIGGRDVDALARHLRSLLENPSLLSHMSKKSLEAVDVYGARRVACSMRILSVCVRVAGPDDLKNLYEWRNNPFVRMGSRSIDAIEWSAHVEWFESVKSCPDRLLLIGEERGSPVGVVRFDITKDAAEVSVYLTPGNSGRSLGFDLLAAAEYWLSENRKDVQFLDAEVLGENVPSRRLFSKARYAVNKTSYRKRIDA